MKEVEDKVVVWFKPKPAESDGIRENDTIDGTIFRPKSPLQKEAEAALPIAQSCGSAVSTGQAKRATAAPGPTAIQDRLVILNLSPPVSTVNTSSFFSSGFFFKDIPLTMFIH